MPIIHTEYYIPKTDKNGFRVPHNTYTYHSQPTIAAVIDQLKVVLDTLVDSNGLTALQGAEWISQTDDDAIEFPRGETFAAMRHGSNEGYLVHIFSYDRDTGIIKCVITIKYLSDKAFTYQVAEIVNEALWDAGFECLTPPNYEEPPLASCTNKEMICL